MDNDIIRLIYSEILSGGIISMQGNIGEKIRHLRIHKQLSQMALVEGICSVAYLSKVEKGKAKPSRAFLQKVAERLNVSVDIIGNPQSDNFLQELELTVRNVEAENRELTSEDESLFNIALIEFVPTELLIRVITALLKNHLMKGPLREAEALYDVSLKLIDFNVNLSNDAEYEKKIYFHLHNAFGKFFYLKENFNKAEYHFLVAERYIINPNNLDSAKVYYNISLIKQRLLEDKIIAIFYSTKAYEIFKKENDTSNLISTLITLGVQYHFAKQYENSLQVLKEAETYSELSYLQNKEDIFIMIRYNMGRVYQSLSEYEQAIFYYNWCLNFKVSHYYKVHILKSLLEIKIHMKQWKEVKILLDEALFLANEHKIISVEIELHWIKAKVFKSRGDYQSYERQLKHAIDMSKENDYGLFIKRMSKELAEYYFEDRFYKKAAIYYALALENV